MILLFNLVCPNGHDVGGMLYEYPGAEPPPEKWMDNMSKQFLEKLRENASGEWRQCQYCQAPMTRNCAVSVHTMKAETMIEAHAALDSVGKSTDL